MIIAPNDPNSRPFDEQDALRRFRQAADSARYYENQTDTTVLDDPRFKHFAATGEYQPSSQAFPDEEIGGANFGQGRASQSPRNEALQQTSQAYNGGQVSPFTSGLRDILMQQLGQYTQAPTVNDPGIAENLAGRRLALQRSAERQQAGAAEQRAGLGLASSGLAATDRLGIEQARGEAEARGVGDVLGDELSNRRGVLMGLLGQGFNSGESESERVLRQILANQQLGLGQDQLAFNYADLNARNNLNTLLTLLNAA